MKVTWSRIAIPALVLTLGFAVAASAGTAPRDPNLDGGVLLGPLTDVPEGPGTNWIDHFDTYATGMQLHGVGGWEGWANSAAAGALTSATQARTSPNSVDVLGGTDLTHPYSGYTSGTWTYTAWQYIPTGYSGQAYYILLNTYSNDASCTGCNWSTQVCFDSATGTVNDDPGATCVSGTQLPIIFDQWVELRLVIDLDTDVQSFYYGGQLLYTDTWTGHVSGSGAVNIGTVDLFANSSTSVFYDDISLSNMPFLDDFESGDLNNWHYLVP